MPAKLVRHDVRKQKYIHTAEEAEEAQPRYSRGHRHEGRRAFQIIMRTSTSTVLSHRECCPKRQGRLNWVCLAPFAATRFPCRETGTVQGLRIGCLEASGCSVPLGSRPRMHIPTNSQQPTAVPGKHGKHLQCTTSAASADFLAPNSFSGTPVWECVCTHAPRPMRKGVGRGQSDKVRDVCFCVRKEKNGWRERGRKKCPLDHWAGPLARTGDQLVLARIL